MRANSSIEAGRVAFSFEGRRYAGFAGDTIASALARTASQLLSRSFKYHRPRGIMSLAGCEANTLVEVDGIPNVLADRHALADGDRRSGAQNYAGSLSRSTGTPGSALFGRFFPVGFYYRAFFRPRGAWRFWEPIVRRMAGLGRVDVKAHHGYYDKAYLFADVAVVGGGPAGTERGPRRGGSGAACRHRRRQPGAGRALNYGRFDARRLAQRDGSFVDGGQRENRRPHRRECEGLFADGWLAIVRERRLYKLRADRVVLATGALEQPAVFRNNDLPGIMLGSAAQRLIRLYGVRPGRRAVVLTANDFGYGVALDLADAGSQGRGGARPAGRPDDGALRSAVLRAQGADQNRARRTTVAEALGRRMSAACASPRASRRRPATTRRSMDDRLRSARASRPALRPISRSPRMPARAFVYDAGRRCSALEAAARASLSPAAQSAFDPGDGARRWRARRAALPSHAGNPRRPRTRALATPRIRLAALPHPKGKEFVDFDEDLTIKDIVDTVVAGSMTSNCSSAIPPPAWAPPRDVIRRCNTIRLAARARGAPKPKSAPRRRGRRYRRELRRARGPQLRARARRRCTTAISRRARR